MRVFDIAQTDTDYRLTIKTYKMDSSGNLQQIEDKYHSISGSAFKAFEKKGLMQNIINFQRTLRIAYEDFYAD